MPPRNITTTLTINIMDVLDPPPTFTESIYTEEIVEDVYANVSIVNRYGHVEDFNLCKCNTASGRNSASN